ncbi:MAG TPA: FlgD immunoglobulin-like domain containing protein [Bryobacteraceae bacterium]|nr:FlgD immunoglobulin-like domain containing protein [Bryobacteraceae bacterium]
MKVRWPWSVRALCTACIGIAALAAEGQLPEMAGLRWRNIGPNRGGRSQAVAGSARRPLEYYFGATGGGLWKTTDGGVSWRPVTDGQIGSSSIGAVAVSDSNPDVVYIGTGETELRASVMQGDGVYRSGDGGKTWARAGLAGSQAIARIRIDPANPDILYAAVLGHPFGRSEERGVFRSRDGGKHWDKVLFRNDRTGAIDLCLDPGNPRVLYASLWEVYRRPWILWSGGDGSGLFKSSDGGDHWIEITRDPGLPKGLLGKINVSVSGADSNRVYANVEADDGGLFRSDDGGATWTLATADRNIRQRAFYFNRIQADSRNRDTVYAMNVGFYRSEDGGKTLHEIRDTHPDHHDLWIAPDNPSRMIVANDGGGSVSTNAGRTWTDERYPTAQFYHVAVTNDVPYHVCGAQQDSGTACVPSQAGASLLPEGDWYYSAGGGEAAYIAPDPRTPNIFYAGDQAGVLTRYDRSTGQLRDVQVNPWMFSGMPAKDLPERWQWVFPIVFSPADRRTLYTSSQHLWKTTNEGQSWQRISPDLTLADPDTLGDSGGPITHDQNGPEIYATIFSVAPSRLDPGTIWTGSDDGLVQITRDGGQHWQNITPPGLPKFSRVSLIEASPHRPGSAFVAAHRYEMDDRQAYIFRTDDYGKTWKKIVQGIAAGDFARAVREDPAREGLLFLGTEHGVYCSLDGGDRWEPLSLNLPDTQVPDLAIQGNDLVIATHGRSFYVLDGIDALRQISPAVTADDFHLFQPAPAMRPRTPARIDYLLKSAAQNVTISILDSDGVLVRKLDSPERKAGLNRIAWDLNYPGPTGFPGMILRGGSRNGPAAVPGHYQVELTVAGKSQRQPLVIEKDPRLADVTDADLREQFAFAIQVRDATSRTNEMLIGIREMKKQIGERVARAGATNARLLEVSRIVARDLSDVESELYQVRNQSPRDTLNYPIKLNNQFAVLLADIEMGDSRPTEQMYVVFRDLSQSLARLAGRLDSLEKDNLAQLDEILRNAGLAPITHPAR